MIYLLSKQHLDFSLRFCTTGNVQKDWPRNMSGIFSSKSQYSIGFPLLLGGKRDNIMDDRSANLSHLHKDRILPALVPHKDLHSLFSILQQLPTRCK